MVFLYRKAWLQNARLRLRLQETEFSKQSLSTKYGKMTEQFIPFLKTYPYDGNNFRFLGTPIDGVQFEDDKVVLVEFKTGDSRLSARQKAIRELVRKGRVEFEEVRIS
jgi:predicted Holliday junction resolvase-like endonuclease